MWLATHTYVIMEKDNTYVATYIIIKYLYAMLLKHFHLVIHIRKYIRTNNIIKYGST